MTQKQMTRETSMYQGLGPLAGGSTGPPSSDSDPDLDFWRGLQPAPEDAQFARGGYLGSSPSYSWYFWAAASVFLAVAPSVITSHCDPDSEAGLLAACSEEAHPAQL